MQNVYCSQWRNTWNKPIHWRFDKKIWFSTYVDARQGALIVTGPFGHVHYERHLPVWRASERVTIHGRELSAPLCIAYWVLSESRQWFDSGVGPARAHRYNEQQQYPFNASVSMSLNQNVVWPLSKIDRLTHTLLRGLGRFWTESVN